MKRLALSVVLVTSLGTSAVRAQDPTTSATPTANRAVNAPCWISLDMKPNQGPFGTDTYDAASIKGFHKVAGTGIVNIVIAGTQLYNFPIDTGGTGHQDDYINQMRLRIAACFGDTTEGLGVGLPSKQ